MYAVGCLVSSRQIGVAVRVSGCCGASLLLRQGRREQFFGFARIPGIAVVIRGHIAFMNCLLILAGLSSSIVYPNAASERKNLGKLFSGFASALLQELAVIHRLRGGRRRVPHKWPPLYR